MIISPTMSVLAAGVASGIFLYIGLRSRKDSKAKETKRVIVDDGRCACCLAPFLVGRGVRCSDCGARSCRKACSRWDTSDNAWHCIFCHQQRSWLKRNDKWFDNFGGTANEEKLFFSTAKSRVDVAGHAAATSNVEQIQGDREEKRMVHAVRNFVEKIVNGLVENVDDTPIDRLYEDSEYDRFLEEHRPPLIAALTRLATCLEASLTTNSAPTNTANFTFNPPKQETPTAFDQDAVTPIFGRLPQTNSQTQATSFSSTPSSSTGFNFGSTAPIAATPGGFNFGGMSSTSASPEGLNFNSPASMSTVTFDPNSRPSFNFTEGNAQTIFNATPQSATAPRKFKKGFRRCVR